MDSYIVQIYHRDRKDPKNMAGVVVEIGKEGRRGFLGPDALWKILSTSRRDSKPKGEPPKRGKTRPVDKKNAKTFVEILKEIHDEEEE
jgi:hypothetical protein